MPSLEINTVNRIRREIQSMGGRTIKTHGDQLMVGEPDVLACIPVRHGNSFIGVFVAIECKQKSKKPTKLQLEILKQWAMSGAIAIWSRDPEEIRNVIGNEIRTKFSGEGMTTLSEFRPRVVK